MLNRRELIRQGVVVVGTAVASSVKTSFAQLIPELSSTAEHAAVDAILRQATNASEASTRQQLLRQVQQITEELNRKAITEYLAGACQFPSTPMTLDQVPRDTAIIYPIALQDRLVILVGLNSRLQTYEVNIGAERLARAVRYLRDEMQIVGASFGGIDRASAELFRWLAAPYLEDLRQNSVSTLVFVSTPELRLLPLATLYDGRRYLIEEFAVVSSFGLGLTSTQTTSVSGDQLLLTEQLTLADFSASLQSNSLSTVHVSAPAYFEAQATDSYIQTLDDKLTLASLYQLLAAQNGEEDHLKLLILSASRTVRGEQQSVLGLSAINFIAGADSSVTSTWQVNAQATAVLIATFSLGLQQGLGKAAALRMAQLELMHSPRFSHPSYWGSFQLNGNGI
ncbi:MAG: CHAT domain-containing protein [Proteobacteria bacterium]|nr:CHAT domain-containing protein [Pseudomonadota bacterium]